MKKILLSLIIIITLAVVSVYIFIPSQLQISKTIIIHCSINGANKILGDRTKWLEWWPGKKEDHFSFNNIAYIPEIPATGSYKIIMHQNNDSAKSFLRVLTAQKDSTALMWSSTIDAGSNPFTRIKKYQAAIAYADNMDSILGQLKNYLLQTENIYGLGINYARVKDTLLLGIKNIIDHQPSTEEIYTLVNKLKTAIKKDSIVATNYPMLNINSIDSSHYILQVAIPVNKAVKEENGITIKRMVPGNILITNDITGGNYSISKAFKALENYTTDFQKIIPAIPFQSLVTDRLQQPDSSKWVTRIYCPIY